MVETIPELKREIKAAEAEIAREQKREKLEVETMRLKRVLKDLKLTPEERMKIQKKAAFKENIKGSIKKGIGAVIRQARLIKEQQEREKNEQRSKGAEVITKSGVTVVRKGTGKKPKKVVVVEEEEKIVFKKRKVPKQLKKFKFKKKNKAAKKKKKPNGGPFGGLPSFDIPGL